MGTTEYAVGSHVFRWCSYLGLPFAFQQHGIVIAVDNSSITIVNFDHHREPPQRRPDTDERTELSFDIGDSNTNTFVRSSSSGNLSSSSSFSSSRISQLTSQQQQQQQQQQRYCEMAVQKIGLNEAKGKGGWEHVQYSNHWHERVLLRAGTCSAAKPDPVSTIMLRIQFLQQQNSNKLLGEEETNLLYLLYHPHKRNGECLAVWCMTGMYHSWQGCAKMGEAGAHIGSFSLIGGVAVQMVAGIVVPVALPFFAAYDVGQAVYSAAELHAAKQEWKERTEEWNNMFEQYLHSGRLHIYPTSGNSVE